MSIARYAHGRSADIKTPCIASQIYMSLAIKNKPDRFGQYVDLLRVYAKTRLLLPHTIEKYIILFAVCQEVDAMVVSFLVLENFS